MNAPTMTEIDDDVKARETAFVSEFFARAALGEGEADILIELLRSAIQAARNEERERCAKIAMKRAILLEGGAWIAVVGVATAIREGK